MKWLKDIFKRPWKMSDDDLNHVIRRLDMTGGFLVPPDEFRATVERLVNEHRGGTERWSMSDAVWRKIEDGLEGDYGLLVKESEFRFWIEYFVNQERGY